MTSQRPSSSRKSPPSRFLFPQILGIFSLALAAVAIGSWRGQDRNRTAERGHSESARAFLMPSGSDTFADLPSSQTLTAESSGDSRDGRKKDGLFETTIRRPAGPPVVHLASTDPQGRSGTVACSTCHSVREPNFENKSVKDLDQFHQGMPFSHGKLSCYSCHNPSDADTLRLADGTAVSYPDVMTLCGQCHGTQLRDYEHGAHGGMNGHWDLSRGPRTRNNCIDCHAPHQPQFPSMKVTFKPRDRFLTKPTSHSAEHGSHSSTESGGTDE